MYKNEGTEKRGGERERGEGDTEGGREREEKKKIIVRVKNCNRQGRDEEGYSLSYLLVFTDIRKEGRISS